MRKLITVLVCIIFFMSANAGKPGCFSFSAGAGAAAMQNARWELSAGFSASIANEQRMLGARAIFSQELILFRTPLQVNEYALYYGKYFRSPYSSAFAAVGGGFSFVSYAMHGERYYPPNSYLGEYHLLIWKETFGASIDAQAGSNIGRFFSIGVHGFA